MRRRPRAGGLVVVHPAALVDAGARLAMHRLLSHVSDEIERAADPIVAIAVVYQYRSGNIGHARSHSHLHGNLNLLLAALERARAHLALRCCAQPCEDRTE